MPRGWESDHLHDDIQPVPPGEAARRLRRRSALIDWLLAGFLVISAIAITTLSIAYLGVSRRADHVSHELEQEAKFRGQVRSYVACLAEPGCPPELKEAARRALADDLTPPTTAAPSRASSAPTPSGAPTPSNAPTPPPIRPTTPPRDAPPSSPPAAPATTVAPAPPPTTTPTTTRPCVTVPVVGNCLARP